MTTTAATSVWGLDRPAAVLYVARWWRFEADRFEDNLMQAAFSGS